MCFLSYGFTFSVFLSYLLFFILYIIFYISSGNNFYQPCFQISNLILVGHFLCLYSDTALALISSICFCVSIPLSMASFSKFVVTSTLKFLRSSSQAMAVS